VAVHTDEPGTQDMRLTLSFQVSAPVMVRPNGRIIIATVEGRPVDRWLRLTADGIPRLEITGIQNPASALIEITSGHVGEGARPAGLSNAAPGDVWVRLHVGADATATHADGVLALTTNHPERPRIEVPIQVRIRPLISPRPATVVLGDGSSPRQPRSVVVRLGHNEGKPFTIKGIHSSMPDLVAAEQLSSGAQVSHLVRIALKGGENATLPAKEATATVRVLTDEPARPEVVIAVQVRPAGS